MAHTISNSDDLIDSRDVIKRISDLEDELVTAQECSDEDHAAYRVPAADTTFGSYCGYCFDEDSADELKALRALADEGESSADWPHGETLIRDSYFEQYARDLADDCGMLDSKVSSNWPYTCIDWEEAARQLQQDYTSISFDGVDYWIRS